MRFHRPLQFPDDGTNVESESLSPFSIYSTFFYPMHLTSSMIIRWTMPIAIACGNTYILKPSEKVPLTMTKFAEYIAMAGFPKGVFQIGIILHTLWNQYSGHQL